MWPNPQETCAVLYKKKHALSRVNTRFFIGLDHKNFSTFSKQIIAEQNVVFSSLGST